MNAPHPGRQKKKPGDPTNGVDVDKVHKRWRHGQDPYEIVNRARSFTIKAVQKLADLMEGNAGTRDEICPITGAILKIRIEVPPAVQAKCAELIIERGYGKAPQAILLQQDSPDAQDNESIYDRIAKIKLARQLVGSTTDLEASEQSEPITLELMPAEKPEDMI